LLLKKNWSLATLSSEQRTPYQPHSIQVMAKPSLSNGGVFQPLLPFQASPPVLLYGNKYGREDGNTTLGIAGVFRIALNDIKKGLNQVQPYLIVIIRGDNQI
jgi:hypothetical protein